MRNRYASLVAEAMHYIDTEYLYGDQLSERELYIAAMKGIVTELDEHSEFMVDKRRKQFNERMHQQYAGIGIHATYDTEEKHVMVEAVMYDSPAFKVGMQSGDLIISAAGTKTEEMKLKDVIKLIKGKVKTKVKLGIRRKGIDDFIVDVERNLVKVAYVKGTVRAKDGSWNYALEENPAISYIRIEQFGDRTYPELKSVISQLGPATKGVILDLRDNGGGLLDSAVSICDMFIDGGLIVAIKDRNESVTSQYLATEQQLMSSEIEVVVLINELSASASEIVAACLQDHERATVVGVRSYGKGTVQKVIELERGKSLLKLTTATYWRKSGQNIHRSPDSKTWGVTPNEGCTIAITSEQMVKMLMYRRMRELRNLPGHQSRASLTEEATDPQLEKAIDVLQKSMQNGDSL